MLTHLWEHVHTLSVRYGVDPVVFGVLYIAHHPLFWGTMAWLAARVRQRRRVVLQIVLGVFFWVMPYAYILLFSRHLPVWVYPIVGVVLVIGGRHAIGEIRKNLARRVASKTPAPASDEPAIFL
ncbi:hypothetical protein CCAX7_19760 [Capsulimonas corticalis]|uniref:Uncharacterized protein n=1 Tax=Capsulimonas corticalis TaxID=2219043 RepID=A0A402D2P0_9BACT|nr:hypothetical protein [Capsulimonas corticalis]BDI29925.1 hypothetical protein CCAX7_19760 [Capsulimonas corticalis]